MYNNYKYNNNNIFFIIIIIIKKYGNISEHLQWMSMRQTQFFVSQKLK